MDATHSSTVDLTGFRRCGRCGLRYDWRKSSSWTLKMTYCSALCEQGDLGFSIETMLRGTRVMRSAWRGLLIS